MLLAAAFNHAGVFGLILLKLAFTAVVILALAAALAETGSSTLVQFAVLIGSAVVIKPYMQFRPQSFTFALLAVLIWLLTRDAYRRTRRLWLAIPMLALWANLHGGFIMGIAATATYGAVSGLQDAVTGRGYRRAVGLAAITGAAVLATLATPYGIGTWLTIAHGLRNPYNRLFAEWQPLASAALEHWQQRRLLVSNNDIGIAMMVVTVISWALTIETVDLALFAIAALMAIAAFISTRNLPIANIRAGGAACASCAAGVAKDGVREGKRAAAASLVLINQAILIALSIVIFVQSGFFSRSLTSP